MTWPHARERFGLPSPFNARRKASIIQSLSGGMMRARLWRSITEHGAVEITKQRHRDIHEALRARDAEQASAADLLHLADGERWLAQRIAAGKTLNGGELAGSARSV